MANCQKCNFGHSLVPSMPSLDYSTISAPWWSIEYWLLFHEGMITSRDWNSTTNRSWNPNLFKADCSDMANCQKCNFGHSLVSSMPSLDYSTINAPWWSIEYWLLFHEGMITSHDWNSTTSRSWKPNSSEADCSDMADCQKCNFGHSQVPLMPSLDYSTISAPWWSIE